LRRGSAPPSRRAFTAAAQRVRTARCNGVTPLLSVAFGSAPAAIRRATVAACGWVPCARARHAIDGVVKGFGTTAVPRANIGPRSYQPGHNHLPVGGGCKVQCSIARVYVMPDLVQVKGLGGLAGRSDLKAALRQRRVCCEQVERNSIVGSDDSPDQRHQCGVGHICDR